MSNVLDFQPIIKTKAEVIKSAVDKNTDTVEFRVELGLRGIGRPAAFSSCPGGKL